RLTRSESGPLEFRLSLPCPADRRFDISMPEATAKVFYYVDFQRDYGRTRRAGVTIPGEAVCRAYFSSRPWVEKAAKENGK
ncbi:MAG: hypothetical protein PHQ27_11240, partial [Victivallales bacterium]|nr:hypothetical protein [Victivallales bacterium]